MGNATQQVPRSPRKRGANGKVARRPVRPVGVYVLLALLLFLAIGALYGGAALISDPSGGLLDMPVALLAGSPFPDYLVPGVILFTLFGVAPLVVMLGLWSRSAWARVPLWGVDGAWLAALGTGAALIVWILVQMLILRFFLQPVLLVQGVAIIAVGLLPSVRRHYAPSPTPEDGVEGVGDEWARG